MATVTGIGSATGNSTSTTLSMTVTASVAVGETIVVATGCFGNKTHTVTDSAGNTYTQRVLANGRTGEFTAPCTSALTSGVSTITVTWNVGEVARTICAAKLASGDLLASFYDTSSTGTAGGTTAAWDAGTTPTLAQADEVIFAACSCDTATAATSTPAGGWTELYDITTGGAFQLTLAYRVVASTAGVNATGTWTGSGWTWNASSIALKLAGGGGGATASQELALMGVGS